MWCMDVARVFKRFISSHLCRARSHNRVQKVINVNVHKYAYCIVNILTLILMRCVPPRPLPVIIQLKKCEQSLEIFDHLVNYAYSIVASKVIK